MILNINNTHDQIEEDIILNQRDVFNRYEYYSRKYSKLSDRINNVNVGLFLNDSQKPTVQIFVQNKTGYRKTHLIFNKQGTKIINTVCLK